jgi:hypothetical protein
MNMIDADPTPNKKYINWVLNQYTLQDDRDVFLLELDNLNSNLLIFDILKKLNKISNKDINQFHIYTELYEFITNIGGTGQNTTNFNLILSDKYFINKKEADIYYEDSDVLIIIPHTLKAAQFYSMTTNWCTKNKFYFDKYNNLGYLYIIFDKYNINNSVQLHFETQNFRNKDNIELISIDNYKKYFNI